MKGMVIVMKTNKITVMGISLISSAIIFSGCSTGLPSNEQSADDVSQSTFITESEIETSDSR